MNAFKFENKINYNLFMKFITILLAAIVLLLIQMSQQTTVRARGSEMTQSRVEQGREDLPFPIDGIPIPERYR